MPKECAVIYYDAVNSELHITGQQAMAADTVLPVDRSLVNRGEYAAAFSAALQSVPKSANSFYADFILPDRMYGLDFITLPFIKKTQLGDAFRTELRSRYKNFSELQFLQNDVHSGKGSTTICTVMMQKKLITELKAVFSTANISLQRFIPYGSAFIANAVKINPAVRKAPCLIVSVDQGYSYIASYGKDTLLGGLYIPFGAEALSDSKLSSERLFYNPDSAELLVINAKERARARKLTMAINIEDELDDEEAPTGEAAAIEPNPELPNITKVGAEETSETPSSLAEGDEEIPREEKIKTLRKSAMRTLPKFMLRETPTTPEGFIAENFRMFERRILLVVKEMAYNEFMPVPETVFLALPQNCSFLAAHLSEQNPEMKWVNLATKSKPASEQAVGIGTTITGRLPVFV